MQSIVNREVYGVMLHSYGSYFGFIKLEFLDQS